MRPSQGTATMKYRARMVPLSGREGVVLVEPCGAPRWPQASESRALMARGRERQARSVFQSQAIRASQPGVKALQSSVRVKAQERRHHALLSAVPAKMSSGFEQPRCCGTELALHGPLVREHTHGYRGQRVLSSIADIAPLIVWVWLLEHEGAAQMSKGHMNDMGGTMDFLDPVCGMTVQESTRHRLEHAGATLRFCSAECLAKFRADPDRYPKRSEAPDHPSATS